MKFIADDGKIFDTMEECEEYEKIQSEGKEIAMLWHNFITIYDEYGEVMESQFDWEEETTNYLCDTANICCDDTIFIKIDCPEYDWEKIKDYFVNEYGTYLPDYAKDIFRYNENDEWVNFRKEYETFKKKWALVGVRF